MKKVTLKPERKILDWTNPKDYEFADTLTGKKWAWEFLRRNPDYVQQWKKDLPLLNSETKDIESCFFVIPGTLDTYYKKWGILNLVDPALDNPFPNPFDQYWSFELGTAQGGNIGHGKYFKDNPIGTYIPVFYDITRPLKPQIANAQKNLLRIQKELVEAGKILVNKINKHRETWLEYLRILDAKLKNIPDKEIARIIFPYLSNNYPDYAGSERVRKSFATAKKLVKKGYRDIAMTF